MSLRSMVLALHNARIDFIIVGGVAANIQGSSRITNDLDICYDTSTTNLDRLAALLNALGAELRGADPGLPFVIDARTLRECPLLTLTTTEGFLDLLADVAGIGNYAEARAVSETIEWDGVPLQSLSLDSLIAAKQATGRKKDQEHLIELEALQMIKTRKR